MPPSARSMRGHFEGGQPFPLGATWDGRGVQFAVYSSTATGIDLCLFDQAEGATETTRIAMPRRTGYVWHVYVPGVRPGQLYGLRAHGPFEPSRGLRHNEKKLLLDPYARAIAGRVEPYDESHAQIDDKRSVDFVAADNAAVAAKCVVVDEAFSWGDDCHPRISWADTILYEAHVRGLTQTHPDIPPELRGTYLGVASEPVIEHLTSLGVTTLELLPIHHHARERHLFDRNLENYWGYSTIGFFAPDARFAIERQGGQVSEFKQMVRTLHLANIEVVLDVVFNHTGEGDQTGPTHCFKGIDNNAFYLLDDEDPARYVDFTGTGNTVRAGHPPTLRFILDSLRYWVTEMHVDGFRFDLTPALARDPIAFERAGRFLAAIYQDPILSRVKLLAEPWDLGPNGYQLGSFPAPFAEWNGRFRDTIRRFWRGDAGQVGELASRFAGSSDLFAAGDRSPHASINFVTCHDGFTVRDLVSYEHKHNKANGEDNRDGSNTNWSCNWGEEGPSDDRAIQTLRSRTIMNLLGTTLLSLGVPMLSHGDELGRTQNGNNNAYCQDNALAWIDWSTIDGEMLEFVQRLTRLRRALPVLRRGCFFAGRRDDRDLPDVVWFREDGQDMAASDWEDPHRKMLGVWLIGHPQATATGLEVTSPNVLVLFNAGGRNRQFHVPTLAPPTVWHELVNTGRPHAAPRALRGRTVTVGARSLLTLADAPL